MYENGKPRDQPKTVSLYETRTLGSVSKSPGVITLILKICDLLSCIHVVASL
jgi:hypothetical protein